MYFPYFRGKQYELATITDLASTIAEASFVPIVEPVRENMAQVVRAVRAISDAGGKICIIANPQVGDLYENDSSLIEFFNEELKEFQECVIAGVLAGDSVDENSIKEYFDSLDEFQKMIVCTGKTKKSVPAYFQTINAFGAAFFENPTSKKFREKFSGDAACVLIRDGFQKRTNREHPDVEFFSDLHVTFESEGMDGFGDMQIVGEEFIVGGGPAYTVAIHLTFINAEEDDEMYVWHFKSDSQDSPKNPAGKFKEALGKLFEQVDAHDSQIYDTFAIGQFRDLYERQHYPGLGVAKKLSMMHHIETLAMFLKK